MTAMRIHIAALLLSAAANQAGRVYRVYYKP